MEKIFFDPKKHKYYVGEEKEEYPSVTTILNKVIAKPYLMYWAVKEAVSYIGENLDRVINKEIILNSENAIKILNEAKKTHEKIRDEAGEIGKETHSIIEKINNHEVLDEKQMEKLDKRIRNSVNAYLFWKKQVGFEPEKSEFICYSKKHKFAGKIDCVGKINNELVIVDFKTTNAIYPEYWLQVAGYYGAFSEMFPDEKIKGCYIVRFGKEDGEEFEAKNIEDIVLMEENFKVFLSAVDLWEWQTKQKEKEKENKRKRKKGGEIKNDRK